MAMVLNSSPSLQELEAPARRCFELSARKIEQLRKRWNPKHGSPVFTRDGKYTARGWTEWTQGFQYGSELLQFEATGEKSFLKSGAVQIHQRMASHLSHVGVHDHGFNNVSTYGNLFRLFLSGLAPGKLALPDACGLALKVSGAVQAARWTPTREGGGYIYSFNGPHSLFIDTIRSLRSLLAAHVLGHALMEERDVRINLLHRAITHAMTTAEVSVYYGTGRDAYDVRGRTAHESIFNCNDGSYRCPNSQQGYSPFSTWSRGLAWAICGFAEELELLQILKPGEFEPIFKKAGVLERLSQAATAAADYYLDLACADGVPYWDSHAPNLHRLGDWAGKPADPFNPHEPVDSSAAAIAGQGLLRLSNFLKSRDPARSMRYGRAARVIGRTLFSEPYLATHEKHEGLILHSVYHRPNGWDQVHRGQRVPNGESSMWGDYHAREFALMLLAQIESRPCFRFFDHLHSHG